MEAVLTGEPQFIVLYVSFLITTVQAGYINRLEGMIIERKKKQLPVDYSWVKNWRVLLLAWWILTGGAVALLLLRVFPSIFFDDIVEKSHLYFVSVDFLVLLTLLVGYILLAVVAGRAWKFRRAGRFPL